ncbi:MAG: hypothetical protein JWN63_528 [Candidatus Acidoferrum typicum]|nr:hypothetical protein [Candidatus Acidoferrum typicum]
MEQPSSRSKPSYPFNGTLRPRVALKTYSLVHLEDEEVTSMPARIAATLPLKKRPGLPLRCAYLIVLVFIFAANSLGQTAHSPGWVVLPVDEYRRLHARAYPIEGDPEPPPVEATLTRVDYDLRIDGELASGRATLTVDVLKDGWVRVPVPSGLLVREARLDGKLVSLVPGASDKGGSQLSALLSHSGRAVLLLDIAIPVVSATGEESITLPSTASGVTRAYVQLPRQGVDARLTGGLLFEKSESAAESKWIVYGRGNEPLTFAWRRKTEDHRATQPLRMRGSLTQLLGLGEDSTYINAEVNLEVAQGAAHMAKIQIPDKVTINQVLGAMVADWEVKANELSVTFLEPVEQTARFVVAGETRSPRDGEIDIPLLRLLNVERETGGVAVEVLGAGEIKDLKFEGVESADATDLGEMVSNRQSPSLAAFRFRSGDSSQTRSLSLNVARYTPQAVLMANVSEARYQVLISSEGKSLVQARYAVRNNQRNFLKITLPPGATLWSASLAGKAVRPGQSPDGSLLLPLDKARAGEEAPEFAVEVVYLHRGAAWNDKGQFKLALPILDLPVSRTGLLVYHPPLFKVTPEPGAFRMESYENPISSALNPPVTYSVTGGGVGPGVHGAVSAFSAAPASPSSDMDLKDEAKSKRSQSATQVLLDKFRTDSLAGKRAGILPIRVSFPAFGPSLYLVSELTGENQAPSAGLTYQHEKKAGGK